MGLTDYKHQVDHTLAHLTDKTRLHYYLNETAQRCVIAAATTIIKDTTSVRRFGYLERSRLGAAFQVPDL